MKGGRRLLLLASAIALAALMLGTYLALLVAGIIGGGAGGQAPSEGGGGAAEVTPQPARCGDAPGFDLAVTAVPEFPGVVGYLEAKVSGSRLEVTLHVVNNGSDIVDLKWLKENGVVVRVFTDTGLQLFSRRATARVTSIAPGEEITVEVTASLSEGARPAYVIAAQPLRGFFVAAWLVDFKAEAGACGWRAEDYQWGSLLARWIALKEGLLTIEVALSPRGAQSLTLEPADPQKPSLEAVVADEEGKPIVKLTGPMLPRYNVKGPKPFVLTAAAAAQLAQPSTIEVTFNVLVNGKPLDPIREPFGEWLVEDFPGSWRTGVLRVDSDTASFVATYWYNGYILVVRTATLIVHENGTLRIPAGFRNTPIGPPTPGAVVKVMSDTGPLDSAWFFAPQLRGSDVIEYVSTELDENNRTVYVYRVFEGSMTLAAWSASTGVKTYAILVAPYDSIDGVLIETPWGSRYVTAEQLAGGQ